MAHTLAVCTGLAAWGLVYPHTAQGQQVLELNGRVVQVFGLRTWTAAMLQDSLLKYAPRASLDSHACAGALRYKLGFANAAVAWYSGPGYEYTAVSVVEPHDSARVRARPASFDTLGQRAQWSDAIEIIRADPGAFQTALDRYRSAAESDSGPVSTDPAIAQVWRFLRAHQRDQDRVEALAALHSDPNHYNRMVAAAILLNFSSYDESWWALVEGLREADGPVMATAALVLSALAREEPRQVNWTPAVESLRVLLDGTSLVALPALVQVLPRTGLDNRWAAPVLGGGGSMVMAFLASVHPPLREDARRLLVALSGHDYGYDQVRWQRWIDSLATPG